MSYDAPIRRITIAEQAEAAARRFVQTGEPETNPHAGTANEPIWRSDFERWVRALNAAEGTEGTA